MLQKITPFLWFGSEAEDAARLSTGIFKNSRIVSTVKYGEAGKDQHHRPPVATLRRAAG